MLIIQRLAISRSIEIRRSEEYFDHLLDFDSAVSLYFDPKKSMNLQRDRTVFSSFSREMRHGLGFGEDLGGVADYLCQTIGGLSLPNFDDLPPLPQPPPPGRRPPQRPLPAPDPLDFTSLLPSSLSISLTLLSLSLTLLSLSISSLPLSDSPLSLTRQTTLGVGVTTLGAYESRQL